MPLQDHEKKYIDHPRLTELHRKTEKRRRKREIAVILITISSLIGLGYFEKYIFHAVERLNIPRDFFSKIIFLGLVNIDIVLILVLLFLIFRNLVKLIIEIKRGKLGSKLRAKLVLVFLFFSIIPTVLLFYISTQFINNSLEKYFSANISQSLQNLRNVVQYYYDDSFQRLEVWSKKFSKEMSAFNYIVKEDNKHFMQLFNRFCYVHEIQLARIYLKGKKKPIESSVNSDINIASVTAKDQEGIRSGNEGKPYNTILNVNKGEFLIHYEPIRKHKSQEVIGTLVVYDFVRYRWVEKLNVIEGIFSDIKPRKNVIKSGYFVLLAMMTLLIIFSAVWLGFYLAREITIPIQTLAEATDQIAEGNLDVHINIKTNDEMGTLVRSFNKMAGDLKDSQSDLRKAYDELSKTSEEIEQRRTYMEAVLINVTAGVVSIGKKGRIQTINKAAASLLRINPTRVIGKNLKDVITQPGHQELVSELLEELNHQENEFIKRQINIKVKDKEYRLALSVEVLRDEAKKYMGMVVVFDDMTDLVKAQRMAAWREVARRIAHEIKNPLTPIKLSAQRLRRKFLGGNSKEQPHQELLDECTKMIVEQVDDLKVLVNEFSKFARLPTVNPRLNNIHELIDEIVNMYSKNHPNLTFHIELKGKIPNFMFDREQIKRVLINFISNSINAISGTGDIIVESDYNEILRIARICVIDTGKGIPIEVKQKMFEPYFSTKKSGTGLGLAIVNQIVADHHGYVRVEDNAPKGTKMFIELPVGYHSVSRSESDRKDTDYGSIQNQS